MFQKLSAFQTVTPAEYNRLVEYVNTITDIRTSPPLEVSHFGGGTQLRVIQTGFQAAVTGVVDLDASPPSSSSSEPSNRFKYTVQEVIQLPNGKWEYLENGRLLTGGIGVWEWNDRRVDVGTVVSVEQWDVYDWRFNAGGGEEEGSSSSSSGSSGSSSSSSSSNSSKSSNSSSSSGSSSSGGCFDLVSNLVYDAEACTLTVTKLSVCIPDCVTVIYS